MSFTITKGYLIDKIDYELFDEIIFFINEYGNIFKCISMGSRKIKSKNARNLRYGSILEFEFFQSRDIDKIGKLKKVTLLEEPNKQLDIDIHLLLLNHFYSKNNLVGIKNYKKYLELLSLIKSDINRDSLLIKMIIDFIFLSGSFIELNHCTSCKSKKIYSLSVSQMGFVCKKCCNEEVKVLSNVIKIIFFIYKKKYNKISDFNKYEIKSTINLLLYFILENSGINLYSFIL